MVTRLEKQSKEVVCVVIHFLHARHISAAKVHCRLVDIYGKEVTSCRSVAKLCSDFKCGRVGTTDNDRSGRPTTASAPRTKCMLKQQYSIADQWLWWELHHDLGLSHGTTARIIQRFGFHKLCAWCTFTLAFEDAILIILSWSRYLQNAGS
jgi:hypothetical protein